MKKILIFLLLTLLPLSTYAQTGTWQGQLNVQGITLPLVFHLNDTGATLDSPAQGAKGIPVERTQQTDGTLHLAIPSIGATYEGKCEGQQITGQFTQNGFSLPLTLTPGEAKVQRPQTPTAPYPYSQEQVNFESCGFTLRGTLVLPKGYTTATPVVLMVTGSGQQNRDEEIFDHKPFAVIADALARQGIASLRYDDRGWGNPAIHFEQFTTADFKLDAQAGLNLLRKRFTHVGVLGHSEGGTIGLQLAADGLTDFVVSLAGMAISGKETLVMQNKTAISQLGLPADLATQYANAVERALTLLSEGESVDETKLADVPQQFKPLLEKSLKQCSAPYFKHFLTLDLRPSLPTIKCPILALNGTKDLQVDATQNLTALEQGLTQCPHTIKSIDGLNHLFQHCTTGSVVEYQQIEETISPEVLTIITNWINALYK